MFHRSGRGVLFPDHHGVEPASGGDGVEAADDDAEVQVEVPGLLLDAAVVRHHPHPRHPALDELRRHLRLGPTHVRVPSNRDPDELDWGDDQCRCDVRLPSGG